MIIDTRNDQVFLIKFTNSMRKYIVDLKGLNEILKNNDGFIEFIKFYDSVKLKFMRLSKKELRGLTNPYFELVNELENRNFI